MEGDPPMLLKNTRDRIDATASNLSGSKFDDVNLSSATLNNVNLSGATIHNADLANLRISDANLSGASITDSLTDTMTIDGIAVKDLMAAYRAVHSSAK